MQIDRCAESPLLFGAGERNPIQARKGFGQAGPLKTFPAYDAIAQAMSGLMSITGFPDGPPTRVGTSLSGKVRYHVAIQDGCNSTSQQWNEEHDMCRSL